MITTYNGIQLPPGYFVSAIHGGILRKKSAPAVDIESFLKAATPASEPEPVIPEVTIEQLMDYNKNVYDPALMLPVFKNVLSTLMAKTCSVNCCAMAECSINNISSLGVLNDKFEDLKHQAIEFGKFFYCLAQDAWGGKRGYRDVSTPGFTLKYKYYTSDNNPFNVFRTYTMFSSFVFTHASHQQSEIREVLENLGCTVVNIGHNTRYPYDSGHQINIYILDRETAMRRFFELHRDYLTAEYLVAQNPK